MGAVTAMTPDGFLPAATFTVRIVYARFTGCFESLAAVMLHVVIPFAPAFKAFFPPPGQPKPFVTRRTDRVLRCRKDPDIPSRCHPIAPHLIGAGVSFVLFLIGGLRHDYGSRFKKQRRLYGAQR